MRNQGYTYTTTIARAHQGQTLLHHLATLYPHSTVEAWRQNLDNGEVTLDGDPALGTETLQAGQVLIWNRPPWVEPDAPLHFEVLWQDADIVAVDKPSGLPTLPGSGFFENTLLRRVQRRYPDAHPVHRLGRATSGVVLFARTSSSAAHLAAHWNTPAVEKVYRAIAQGIAGEDHYQIETPIGRVPHPRLGTVWAAHPAGKPSCSAARVLARGADSTLFSVRLHSGRPHQIRIHLASIGHPLTGDPLYGPGGQPLPHLPGLPGDGGYFLHAHTLQFRHPATGAIIAVEAPLPPAFSSAEVGR